MARLDPSTPLIDLPAQLTSFVGRQREIADVKRALTSTRLLTLTGTGGVGKTRLALQVGADLTGVYPGGVWQVELASVADPGVIAHTVAGALGLHEVPGEPPLETLVVQLQARDMLLILDNCEHVVEACAVGRPPASRVSACPDFGDEPEGVGRGRSDPFRPSLGGNEVPWGNVLGDGYHACPDSYPVSGIHVGRDLLLCGTDALSQTGEFLDAVTVRTGVRSCPGTTFMVGVHQDRDLLLCSSAFTNQGGEYLDRSTVVFGSTHGCLPGFAMTGANVGPNVFGCAHHWGRQPDGESGLL